MVKANAECILVLTTPLSISDFRYSRLLFFQSFNFRIFQFFNLRIFSIFQFSIFRFVRFLFPHLESPACLVA